MITVGDRALVLHAWVGYLDQLVTIFLERILAEVMLVGFEHSPGLRKLSFRLPQIFRQRVEIQRQIVEPIRKVRIVPDVQRDVVVVDGILHQPIPTCVSIVKISLADELPVRNISEIVRYLDADLHRLDFVFPLIFVRPPDAGAFALASSENPWTANWVFAESEATETANR